MSSRDALARLRDLAVPAFTTSDAAAVLGLSVQAASQSYASDRRPPGLAISIRRALLDARPEARPAGPRRVRHRTAPGSHGSAPDSPVSSWHGQPDSRGDLPRVAGEVGPGDDAHWHLQRAPCGAGVLRRVRSPCRPRRRRSRIPRRPSWTSSISPRLGRACSPRCPSSCCRVHSDLAWLAAGPGECRSQRLRTLVVEKLEALLSAAARSRPSAS